MDSGLIFFVVAVDLIQPVNKLNNPSEHDRIWWINGRVIISGKF